MKLRSDHELLVQTLQEHMADADSEWWPFAFLRPETHEAFTNRRCALLALLNGVPPGLFAMLVGKLMGDHVQGWHLALFPLGVVTLLFVTFRVVLVPFWNQRAERLRPLVERRAEWRRSLSE